MAGLTTVTPAQQHAITYSEASDYMRLDDQQDVDRVLQVLHAQLRQRVNVCGVVFFCLCKRRTLSLLLIIIQLNQ